MNEPKAPLCPFLKPGVILAHFKSILGNVTVSTHLSKDRQIESSNLSIRFSIFM